jgi:hypothetical protein
MSCGARPTRRSIARTLTARTLTACAAIVSLTSLSACRGPFRAPTGYEQTYLAALHNGAFRTHHARADALFNAFDYGHAIGYETLLTKPSPAAVIEGPVFARLDTRVLRRPPSVPLEEAAVGPRYATLVPEVVAMFEWSHLLHKQLYDVLAIPDWHESLRDKEVARVLAYYRSRPDLAFSSHPKSMALMDGQPYSQVFRQRAPKFNGLLWTYHWMQMSLYDALMADPHLDAQRTAVGRVVDRFFALIANAPSEMPTMMPMSAAVAPRFSARYPEAAIIFDNMHAMHDVLSDILLSEAVPAAQKRQAILRAAATYRDSTTEITTRAEWLEMAQMMTESRLRPPPGTHP